MSSVPSTNIPQQPLERSLSLDERIRRAELRLIAREDHLKRRIDSLGRRLHEATRPQRYIAPVIGGAAVLLTLWWLLRGRGRPRPTHSAVGAAAHARSWLDDMPWVQLLALVWPLLPMAWRSRVNPATAATVVSVGLPLAARLLARSRRAPRPRPRSRPI
jgi:hypothetical protein